MFYCQLEWSSRTLHHRWQVSNPKVTIVVWMMVVGNAEGFADFSRLDVLFAER